MIDKLAMTCCTQFKSCTFLKRYLSRHVLKIQGSVLADLPQILLFNAKHFYSIISKMQSVLVFFIFLQFYARTSDGSAYTAMTRLRDLALMENTLVQSLDEFIAAEKAKLDEAMKLAELIKLSLGNRTTSNPDEVFGSPLEVYTLFKRFIYYWKSLGNIGRTNNSKEILEQLNDFQPYFPTVEEDLYGSISAIFLLQDTYNISAKDMASGKIPGSSIKNEIHADDSFELGSFALYFGRYHRARDWLNVTLDLARRPRFKGNIDKPLLLELASWAEYTTGNLEKALEHCVELLKISPDNARAMANAERYRREIKTGLVRTYEHVKADEDKNLTEAYQNTKLSKLCREKFSRKSHGPARQLICRYVRDDPILKLKPAKEEVVLVEPRIVIFRDMVRDRDLEKIKDVARPNLERSKAFNLATGQLETVSYRISESAWIHENATDAVKRFNRRAGAVSGLSMATAEDLQVANYGLGGQYEEHHDHGYPDSPLFNHVNGNRLATMLLYLTSVPYGGGTAFTRLSVYVRPNKGDAVFWYNLKQSGVGDNSTFHAACPVLTGIKWVGNKWFHTHGQEFRRPCTLTKDD